MTRVNWIPGARSTEHDDDKYRSSHQPGTAMGHRSRLSQLVELGGQDREFRQIRIERDDFVDYRGRLVNFLRPIATRAASMRRSTRRRLARASKCAKPSARRVAGPPVCSTPRLNHPLPLGAGNRWQRASGGRGYHAQRRASQFRSVGLPWVLAGPRALGLPPSLTGGAALGMASVVPPWGRRRAPRGQRLRGGAR